MVRRHRSLRIGGAGAAGAVRAILFDLDRTLVDVQSFTDYPAALDAVEDVIGEWADPPTPATGWEAPTRRAMGILVALAGDPRWQTVSDLIEGYERAAVPQSRPMRGVERALAVTADRRRAVVTLLTPTVAAEALARHRLAIEAVVGRSPGEVVKPAPDQLLKACRLLEVAPAEATMIGDSAWDEAAAAAAGCRFVGVTNGLPGEFSPDAVTAATVDEAVLLID